MIINDSTITDTLRHVSPLVNNTTYSWRVRAKNAGGASGWSVVRWFTYSNPNKWKIVSLPKRVSNPRKEVLFPTALSPAFAYVSESGYAVSDSLRFGLGYWLKFGVDKTKDFAGDSVLIDTIEISKGWNLIGSISNPISVSSITSIPPGIATSKFFGYGTSYVASDSIQPGQGYWVKSSENGELVLSIFITQSAFSRISIMSTPEVPPSPPNDSFVKSDLSPKGYLLEQNYPNPFNPFTKIQYSVPSSQNVRLKVFDMLGREVATLVSEQKEPGVFTVSWNANSKPSGVYFYQFQAGSFVETKMMLLLR